MITIYAGKGGVGKSTLAASTAVFNAHSGKKVLAIDYDGGKALSRVLQFPIVTPNILHKTGIDNLIISGIQNTPDKKSRYESGDYDQYMKQFPEQYGLVALNDMIQEFFGITTDIVTLEKYIALVSLLDDAKKQGIDDIVLDVEPTVGLQRLIQSSGNIARSLSNLNKTGRAKLKLIGAAWPDIKKFIESEYVKKSAHYMNSFSYAQRKLSEAIFSVVSIPEPDPVSQAIEDVVPIIQSIQGSIQNIILNNVGRLDTEVENEAIRLAGEKALDLKSSVLKIPHNPKMFSNGAGRIETLYDIGKQLF